MRARSVRRSSSESAKEYRAKLRVLSLAKRWRDFSRADIQSPGIDRDLYVAIETWLEAMCAPRKIEDGEVVIDEDARAACLELMRLGQGHRTTFHPRAKLCQEQVVAARKFHEVGVLSIETIAKALRVSPTTVRMAVHGFTWKEPKP